MVTGTYFVAKRSTKVVTGTYFVAKRSTKVVTGAYFVCTLKKRNRLDYYVIRSNKNPKHNKQTPKHSMHSNKHHEHMRSSILGRCKHE